MQIYTVAVRALCEFTAKAGDLDLRFTPSPSAQEGIAGHAQVTSRRGPNYEREVSVSGRYQELEVRGRLDGFDAEKNRLEEIKTFRGDFASLPDNHRELHWAQAKIYGALLCRARELDAIELALVYFDIVKQQEHSIRERYTRDQLQLYFFEKSEQFLTWARQELAHRQARDSGCERLVFPHPQFRAGQRVLAEALYKTASTGRCLLAQAPTGIGKTVGSLFPLLKACAYHNIDKIFFLTAKTPGRRLALEAIELLNAKPLRTLELIAREKACEHPDKACHGESCPLAKGFYDRLADARRMAVNEPLLKQARVREIALIHNICPYYLAQEMMRWSDVIIGDYNYYFDLSAMLHSLSAANSWRVALLVDEAHNLVERGRAMYSAQLSQTALRQVRKLAPAQVERALTKLNAQWRELNSGLKSSEHECSFDAREQHYFALAQLPQAFLESLQGAMAALADFFAEQPFAPATELTQFYFDGLSFLKVAELFDRKTYIADVTLVTTRRTRHSQLNLRNVIPAALLSKRFSAAYTATLFSATLRPDRYYRDMLGLPENTMSIEVPAPFSAQQLQVRIARDISTRFVDRASSVQPIAKLIDQQYRARPGNYLAFFSSYQYLDQVLSAVGKYHPNLPTWFQAKNMNEREREAFLSQFVSTGQGIGFAVLGGAFGEGVDLPGKRLIGAFIATLGLPQTNPVNEQIRQTTHEVFGDGYNYTYLYPGLQKVVQAAGRVIRTEQDEGIVHLIDDRFTQARVRALLPSWWRIE